MAAATFQVPTEAERIIMDRELKNKHEAMWKLRTDNIVEDLEAAKLSIHNLMQENLGLKVTVQQKTDESQRMVEEAKLALEAKIVRLKSEKDALMNNQRPQLKTLETEGATLAKENAKLRHQVKVS